MLSEVIWRGIGLLKCIIIAFLVFQTYMTYAHQSELIFNIVVDQDSPNTAVISSDTSSLGEFTMISPRKNPVMQRATLSISCINVDSKSTIQFEHSSSCAKIEWTVPLNDIQNNNIDVSEQNSLYSSNGWSALFEWDSIPRVEKIENIQVCVGSSTIEEKAFCRPLPNDLSPPLIFIFGYSSLSFTTNEASFRIFSDNHFVKLLGAETQKEIGKQFKYLSSLFSAPNNQVKPEIDLAWVPIDKKFGNLGGAAGSAAYISNYLVSDNPLHEVDKKRLFWITGHETFHMLSPYPYPLWMSESLAHYYGYKSLAQQKHLDPTPLEIWMKKRSSFSNADTGLYEAHTKVAIEGQTSYYGLFYFKGTAFWYELDSLLTKKNSTLDEHLHLIIESENQHSQISEEFSDAMSSLLGETEYRLLLSKYLL